LKKEGEKHEEIIKEMVYTEPPSYPCIENTPCINFNEGSIALMWDKIKGKPRYDQRNDNSWLGPYIVKKKLIKKSTI
jgi:hypothetical protein